MKESKKDPARKKKTQNLTMNEKNGYSNDAELDLLHPCSILSCLFHFFDNLLLLSYSSLLTATSAIG